MPAAHSLLTFALAAIVVLLVPGPTLTFVITRSLEGGRLAGLCSALGGATGSLIHALVTAVGLTGLLLSTPWAFTTIKVGGVAFLVYLGIRQFRVTPFEAVRPAGRHGPTSAVRHVRDGVVIDLLNPKAALFFLAFLPQFVDPARGAPSTQLVVFAMCTVPMFYLMNIAYAVLAARISTRLRGTPSAFIRIIRGTGFVYLGLAAFAGFALLA